MEVCRKYSQTRANERKQRKHDFSNYSFGDKHKGLVNLTFAHLSILTARMKDGFLEIVAIMACDTPASCVGTILLGGLIDLSGAAKAWKGRGAAS